MSGHISLREHQQWIPDPSGTLHVSLVHISCLCGMFVLSYKIRFNVFQEHKKDKTAPQFIKGKLHFKFCQKPLNFIYNCLGILIVFSLKEEMPAV